MRTMFAILFVIPTALIASDSDRFDIACTFDFGQYLDPEKDETDTQSTPLIWNFLDLNGENPRFLSGGDTGAVLVIPHGSGDGISIFLPQFNGAHLFTVWKDSTAFWSKHNDILGSKATQQFRGMCENIRHK